METRPEVPDHNISGSNRTEQLQDVYRKNQLFCQHLEKTREFQKTWMKANEDTALNRLFAEVDGGLFHLGPQLNKTLLSLNVSVPEVDTFLNLSTVIYDADKQKYGCCVINNLKLWLQAVYKLLT